MPIRLSTNFLSTKGTKKYERKKSVLFHVFRVFRGPSLLYSCSFVFIRVHSWFSIRVIRSSRLGCPEFRFRILRAVYEISFCVRVDNPGVELLVGCDFRTVSEGIDKQIADR